MEGFQDLVCRGGPRTRVMASSPEFLVFLYPIVDHGYGK